MTSLKVMHPFYDANRRTAQVHCRNELNVMHLVCNLIKWIKNKLTMRNKKNNFIVLKDSESYCKEKVM